MVSVALTFISNKTPGMVMLRSVVHTSKATVLIKTESKKKPVWEEGADKKGLVRWLSGGCVQGSRL